MKSCLIEAINWLWFLIMAVPFMPSLFVNSATFVLWTWYKLKAFNRFMQALSDKYLPYRVMRWVYLINILWAAYTVWRWIFS